VIQEEWMGCRDKIAKPEPIAPLSKRSESAKVASNKGSKVFGSPKEEFRVVQTSLFRSLLD